MEMLLGERKKFRLGLASLTKLNSYDENAHDAFGPVTSGLFS
jgi:hypothetical protein